jgi:hypothetical protein
MSFWKLSGWEAKNEPFALATRGAALAHGAGGVKQPVERVEEVREKRHDVRVY